MIKLIIGARGTGKTKKLIELTDYAVKNSLGCVMCVEKTSNLAGNISRKIRLMETDDYDIEGPEALKGFLMGIVAGNYDTTDIFVDATFKIIGRNYEDLVAFFASINKVLKSTNTNIYFTLSCEKSELPEEIFCFCEEV